MVDPVDLGPVKVNDQHDRSSPVARVNAALAVAITRGVGSMWTAYAFAVLALVGLPGAIAGGLLAVVEWVAQTFLQLVLLAILAVGARVAADAADARAEATFDDTELLRTQNRELREALDQVAERVNDLHTRFVDPAPAPAPQTEARYVPLTARPSEAPDPQQ